VSEVPDPEVVDRLRAANSRLRDLLTQRDGEIADLQVMVKTLLLQVAELKRQRDSGSDDSGTPSSKESIAAKARRTSERTARRDTDTSSRERSADRSRGAQPGHRGRGLVRDPEPDLRERVEAPAVCRGCGAGLDGAGDAGTAWSQVWDVRITPWRIEYLLPRRECGCGSTTTAPAPPGAVVNGISYGPVLNTMAIALSAFGNVPTERTAHLVGMLTGQAVSAGFVDRANGRLAAELTDAGFAQAVHTALMDEPVLAADESPVQVITPAVNKDTGEPVPGKAHVMVLRTPDERLVLLSALDSRRHEDVIASLRTFTGYLITDGYLAYQKLLPCMRDHDHTEPECHLGLLAGLQQCCQHVIRRARGVAKLGPGTLQSWATKVIKVLSEAHDLTEATRERGESTLDPQVLANLRERYDAAVAHGVIHNRHRDWHEGNHPAYALATWLRAHAEQVWLFTRNLAVDWTSNAAERGVKPAKRHQAVSGYWQNARTLARWCLINSYLTSARNHGLTALDAITRALQGRPWLPQHALA
jgi:transposase